MMKTLTGFVYYPDSLEEAGGVTYFMVRSEEDNLKYLGVMGDPAGFTAGQGIAGDSSARTHLFPLTAENAAALRERLPWLNPQPLGMRLTLGFGDRLGIATPGHVQAVESAPIAPIFAQQSVREDTRAHRTPQQVLDDAMWGVLQTGWRRPWGADADHLKTPEDLDRFYDAGFTFFTLDPSEHVDDSASSALPEALRAKVHALPWDQLHSTLENTRRRFLGHTFQVEDYPLSFDEDTLLRALVKFGQAIAHTAQMARHLQQRAAGRDYDLEVSIDETELPTSPEEHYLIASELQRLDVPFTSLAPHFVGRFEKGVDYIGDTGQFEQSFAVHAAIARHFGNYRLSLHTGSDKLSIYPIAARQSRGLLHVKTAGTSYLEALRIIAQRDPARFRKALQIGIARYEIERATYHVSASLDRLPDPDRLADNDLPDYLNQFDARQVLHVTFGAVLERFGPDILATLRANENLYYAALAGHFKKHLSALLSAA